VQTDLSANIRVLPFKHKHYGMVLSMLQDQKTPWVKNVSYKNLPKIGYIALLGKHPIAAAFLRKIEGGYGYLDTFVSNPYFGSKIRHEALSEISKNLMEEAKNQGMSGVLCSSAESSLVQRAKDWGFTVIEHTVLGKIID